MNCLTRICCIFSINLSKASILIILLLFYNRDTYAQTVIKGTVENESGIRLPGVSISVKDGDAATSTDNSGNFVLQLKQLFPLRLMVSFTGYQTKEVVVPNDETALKIVLTPQSQNLEEVVISASRRPEKIQEAPVAISVIGSKKILNDVVGNPFLSLRNLTGVDVGQAGVNSGMITLRGSSTVFQTETFVMLDYRNLVLPGLGTLGYSQQPIDAIDLSRVEVIKGPGSALYGPGVEAGIVHFISKSPIDYPGTTVSIAGGSRSAFETAVRVANTNRAKNLGYKILGYYRTAQDWPLRPDNPVDAAHLALYKKAVISSLTGDTIFKKIPDYRTESYGITGTLEYKPGLNTTITGVGGYSTAKYIYRTAQGEGYAKAPRTFTQLRLQSGGLFAQAFWSYYDGSDGNTGLYTTGFSTITKSHQLEGQVQYSFSALNNRMKLTAGSDYRSNTVDTKGTVSGRYENDDKVLIAGAYLQTDTRIVDKLNFVAAGRIDRFTALSATSFSPRLGLVYKAAPEHSFRATFNHAVSCPTSISLFSDLALLNANAYSVHLLAGAQPVTFNNPKTTSFLPGNTVYDGVGQALAPVYAVLTAGISSSGNLPKPLTDYLASLTPVIPGASAGVQSMPVLPRDKLRLSSSNMYEAGYKGSFANKLNITLDLYYNVRKNMLSAPVTATPLVVQTTLGADMATAVAATVSADELAKYGLTPGQLASIYQDAATSLAINANGGYVPLGVIRSDQAPLTNRPTVDLSYYNLRQIRYAGIDAGAEYLFNNYISVYGSVSWLSKTLFKNVPVGEQANAPVTNFSLNVPSTKIKGGIGYQPSSGFTGSVAVRYQNKWEAINGALFTGPVDACTMADLSIGYGFKNGLKINATCTNLFNEDYRFIYGAPIIGHQLMVRTVYNFGTGN
ncbi:hypothetical protein DJ568_14395 [Mucilaginibacter hurinus]|uniref:TonB-dependent receptor n=1 Tax=Mucilaginibacter hurinus TaxID=2201324 RepID=A0A367GKS4_9SPHI|nr:TonB-dependent receptor [Mucilaginibacter hurinus]RCH54069.1 hypothetical protein DJ568_14395 [Mucilaginibacter hurinus]